MLEGIGSIFIKINLEKFLRMHIDGYVLRTNSKLTKDNISNDCFQNTHSNNKNIVTSFCIFLKLE